MNKDMLIIIGVIILLFLGFVGFNNFKNTESSPAQPQTNTPAITQTSNESSQSASASITCSKEPLVQLTEGPYYTPNSPQKQNLAEPGIPGEKLVLTGYVLNTNCQPISGAWIDFWQADGEGNYDNAGYKLRGNQFTDLEGRYTLTTVIPGEYPGRTPHVHLKIRASENSPIVTSQLFIPGVSGNETDNIYDQSLLINNVQQNEAGKTANFNFVIEN